MINIQMKNIDFPKEETIFYEFIMNNTDYFTDYVNNQPTINEIRKEFLTDVPPDIALNNKEVYIIYKKQEMVGFLDLLFHYPDNDSCMLGYLVIDKDYRSQGIGQQVYNEAMNCIINRKIKKIRLGVIKENRTAVKMWEKQGFKVIDEQCTSYGNQFTMELEH